MDALNITFEVDFSGLDRKVKKLKADIQEAVTRFNQDNEQLEWLEARIGPEPYGRVNFAIRDETLPKSSVGTA